MCGARPLDDDASRFWATSDDHTRAHTHVSLTSVHNDGSLGGELISTDNPQLDNAANILAQRSLSCVFTRNPQRNQEEHLTRPTCLEMLNIEVPVISAINGPAWRHSEIPLLCDIVLAADTAQFQDSAHFASDVVPGDGMHIVYPLLLGMNRGRYFLMTGQTLDAAEALRLGLVAEVLPPDKLLARAWALAEELTRKPTLLLRYTRLLFTEYLRRQMHDLLGYGLAMESLALFEKPEAS